MNNPRTIAFYLPQYYPTPENDKWWGKGFTEWTNVGKAKPLFKGHYQPKVPADLGYYDLRIPDIREQQATMAKEAGIEGFCYWHYWFAGQRMLDKVFDEVVKSGKPNFPFCLCWANHSWYKKTWNPDIPDELLIEQTYPGIDDYTNHFYAMLPAFKDKRYIKVKGKILFGVFAPKDIPNPKLFFDTWNSLAKTNGLNGFYFFGYTIEHNKISEILNKGFDSVVIDYVRASINTKSLFYRGYVKIKRELLKLPHVIEYSNYIKCCLDLYNPQNDIHLSIDPNFDHSPRSAQKGTILVNSTPKKWGELCRKVFKKVSNRPSEENLVFIKAWNEWGEGNYLEPDLKYGTGYLDELKNAFKNNGTYY